MSKEMRTDAELDALAAEEIATGRWADEEPDLRIIHEPRRCAGHPTVGETRICVHDIVADIRLYSSREEWRRQERRDYPEAIVDAALAYYESNREEIEEILAERRRYYEACLEVKEPTE